MFTSGDITNTTAGLIGEHLAAASILQRGWSCAMVQQDGFDLIAMSDRESYRVQVKACSLYHRRSNSLQFPIGIGRTKRFPTPADWDILAIVSSDLRAVSFIPIHEVNKQKITRSLNLFTPDDERDSWDHTIEVLRHEYSKSPPLHNHRTRNGVSRNRIVSPPHRRGS